MRPAVDVHGARAANTLSTGAPAVVGEEAADTDKGKKLSEEGKESEVDK